MLEIHGSVARIKITKDEDELMLCCHHAVTLLPVNLLSSLQQMMVNLDPKNTDHIFKKLEICVDHPFYPTDKLCGTKKVCGTNVNEKIPYKYISLAGQGEAIAYVGTYLINSTFFHVPYLINSTFFHVPDACCYDGLHVRGIQYELDVNEYPWTCCMKTYNRERKVVLKFGPCLIQELIDQLRCKDLLEILAIS